jgi:hypothetical protein
MRAMTVILALAISGLPGGALASSHCESLISQRYICALPLTDFAPASARLSDAFGNVQITTANQYSPTDQTIPLNIGDAVLVLEDSGASLTFGPACGGALPEQSQLVIRVVEGCALAELVETQTQAATTRPNGTTAVLGTLAIVGLGTGIYFLSQSGDDGPVTNE